ncbi:MAG: type II secretion system F family protein [Haloferacaceae archaeon]
MLYLAPLVAVLLLVVPVVLSPVSRRADLMLSRVALPVFGDYVSGENPRKSWQVSRLRAAHVGETHRVYASRTLLLSGLGGVVGSVVGVYAAAWLLELFAVSEPALRATLPAALRFLSPLANLSRVTLVGLFVILLFASATLGSVLAFGTYWARWAYLDQLAQARASQIEASLPRTIAFTYALSRSGMPFPKVLEALARNEDIYGEAAREVGVTVRDMDTFSTDVLTALRRMARRTPSEGLEDFSENLASVLGSGRNLSSFLNTQYERYREEAEAQQQQYLDLVSTFAEIYVTTLVAGPLFLITVLVIIGLVIENTLTLTRIVGYLGIPLASLAFGVYVDSLTQKEQSVGTLEREELEASAVSETASSAAADAPADTNAPTTDGGVAEHAVSRERLAAYDRLRWLRRWVDEPLESVLRRPEVSFLVTVPLGLVWLFARSIPIPLGPSALQALDHPFLEATIVALAVYALLHETHKYRRRRIEEATPDFLDRMASVNEAGLTVVESLERISRSDLGQLEENVERTWRDVRWGGDTQTAFRRLAIRARARMVSQAVVLITNAMRASGDIAPVLRIAADEAQDTRRLRRERRQEMLTYLLVIYISVFVFLGIIAALTVAFIPAVKAASQAAGPTGGAVGGVPGISFGGADVPAEAYQLLFFHVSSIQAVCSGLIAGQLAEGGAEDGLKHATILLAITYVAFAVLI